MIIRSSVTETIEGQTRPKHGTNLISVDLDKSQMDLDLIDIGTKSKNLLNSSTVSKDLKKDFLKKCLSFYIIVTKYLISKLPLSSKLLKNAQYLDPNKHNSSASLNAVSRLSLKVASTLKGIH